MKACLSIINRSSAPESAIKLQSQLMTAFIEWGYTVGRTLEENDEISICLEEELPQHSKMTIATSAIVIADPDMLEFRYNTIRANEHWSVPYRIRALVIPYKLKNFRYLNSEWQFSPMCLVHIPSRHLIVRLVSYLINHLDRQQCPEKLPSL